MEKNTVRDWMTHNPITIDENVIGVLTIKDLIDALFHLSAVALRRDSESLSDRLQS